MSMNLIKDIGFGEPRSHFVFHVKRVELIKKKTKKYLTILNLIHFAFAEIIIVSIE